jgi:glc operon protein GlcG
VVRQRHRPGSPLDARHPGLISWPDKGVPPKEEEIMLVRACLIPLAAVLSMVFATQASAQAMIRDQKVISSAGARAMVDACTAWAERNHLVLAMSVLDWAGNQLESHAMEGAGANSIDTALLKAKSALRWKRPTSEMNQVVRSGQNLAPTFMHDFPQPGALPIIIDGQMIGAMGVSSADGEKCAQAAIDAVFKTRASAATP